LYSSALLLHLAHPDTRCLRAIMSGSKHCKIISNTPFFPATYALTLPLRLIQPPQKVRPLPQRTPQIIGMIPNLTRPLLKRLPKPPHQHHITPPRTPLHNQTHLRQQIRHILRLLHIWIKLQHPRREFIEMPTQRPQIHRLSICFQRVQDAWGERSGQVKFAEGGGGGADALDREDSVEPEREGYGDVFFNLMRRVSGDTLDAGGGDEGGVHRRLRCRLDSLGLGCRGRIWRELFGRR